MNETVLYAIVVGSGLLAFGLWSWLMWSGGHKACERAIDLFAEARQRPIDVRVAVERPSLEEVARLEAQYTKRLDEPLNVSVDDHPSGETWTKPQGPDSFGVVIDDPGPVTSPGETHWKAAPE